MVFRVEIRRTYEWGNSYEAESAELAVSKAYAEVEFEPEGIVDEQCLVTLNEGESVQ